MDLVRQQYEAFPYPKVTWLGRIVPSGAMHASYEAGASLCLGEEVIHNDKRILLLGCGTMEPYIMSAIHPQAHITAVDLSAASIQRARWKCRLHRQKNVSFICDDLLTFARKHQGTFDYIHCFGVLHHLENPSQGFQALEKPLAPRGFARLMYYSRGSRARLGVLREALNLLGIHFQEENGVREALKVIEGLPKDHPLRIAFESCYDRSFSAGIVDSILHACESPYSWTELKAILSETNLQHAAWDFSQNQKSKMEGYQNLDKRMASLEKDGQWRFPFTFWVTKSGLKKAPVTRTIVNPLWNTWKRNFWSVLLKRNVDVDLKSQLKRKEMIDARVLLEVR